MNELNIKADSVADNRTAVPSVVIRFAGDSGDGIQITGSRFTDTTALAGNDLATFPDFPAEIRAPVGTTFGVSAFQINFGARSIETHGDEPDVLVALNPAALMVNIARLRKGGSIIVDTGSFNARNLKKAGYETNPLEDGSLDGYKILEVDVSKNVLEAVKEFGLSQKEGLRCKNFWVLGLVYWIYGRDRKDTIDWLRAKFAKRPDIADANIAALNAGHIFGEAAELSDSVGLFSVGKAEMKPGLYRTVTGGEALAWGLVAGSQLAGLEAFFGSYPITPASPILHSLAKLKQFGVKTFQAEDEIAAICSAIGASYAGALGITSSSGPGIALKGEAIGLAISTELPLVIVNSQRAGPSTGLPTKTEQSDLYQSVYGRNGDAPLVVLAAHGPSDCFEVAIEACRLATKYMTPVMLLTDGYIGNAAEPWLIPTIADREPFTVEQRTDPEGYEPFNRNPETLARPWAVPGTPGLEHRIGGIEKADGSGHISYEPANHQTMTDLRRNKILGIARDIPEQKPEQGESTGKLAVIGWGSTYGPISRAVSNKLKEGKSVAQIHLRHLWPLPANLGDLLKGYDTVIVPEMNDGQLKTVLRDQYLIDARPVTKVTGQPFKITEIEDAIDFALEN
ncbi:2-oxoacid:acceptor oxidoreductase subunit alpha [Sneathiella chinensis]|uniref:2-oxoglutarate ferredoxin oxidoreductase subunit alpha n=1 Tax=Sneathiella chinensis TaxID=349750 RepID=A0ABQ5U0D3_9PROT|nr:2-oxoacid:acceptor oxidoreductase subunit alpha [Sneathiella chinensis]GLQ05595.1 2-oxoglutarate ferredoxin oxidoreductase subunit alpha [Sneathiella chinensis]